MQLCNNCPNLYRKETKLSRPILKSAQSPNILLIMTDQHAARALGVAGDKAAQTPNLDKIAKSGTRFTNVYCASPLCVPSRTAFLTGLEPHQSGVLNNDDLLQSDIPTIAHSLGKAGYDCHLIGRMHFNGPDQLHGFSARPIGDIGPGWPGAEAPFIGSLTNARGNRGDQINGSGRGETSYQAYDSAVTKTGIETLVQLTQKRDKTERPFFALVSLFCPHPPYVAPPKDYDAVVSQVPPPEIPAPKQRHQVHQQWAKLGLVDVIEPEAAIRARAAYYGLVRMIDRLVGDLVSTVSNRDDTVIIYVSDHGEALGERGLWWKSTFYDESAKVPLIISGPGIESGVTDNRVMSLMDVSATILDLADADPLPGQMGHSMANSQSWENRATSSYYGGLMNIKTPATRQRMLRRDHLKLCVYDGYAPQFFDLAKDPREIQDISNERPKELSALMQEISATWNPGEIAKIQNFKAKRTKFLREWVQTTKPEERFRWKDPNPERNRYI